MTEPAAPAPTIDVKHYREVLCRVRQMHGGDLMLVTVLAAAQAADGWAHQSPVFAGFWVVLGVVGLVAAVWLTISNNRADDAMAAGPPGRFVSHCRGVLTAALGPGPDGVMTILWAAVGVASVALVVIDLVGEDGHRLLDAAAHATFAITFGARPLWNRWRRRPVFARELAALPPPPPPPTELAARIRDLLAEGKKIQAIKHWRDVTGDGLRDAKQAVERIESPSA
jgi:hypothetical protein